TGNDLPPRHAPGQTLNNIRFILENEADLPGLSKEWVVNRVVNTTERKAIIALLEQHNQVYTDIEVDLRKYSQIQTDWANVDFNWQDITRYTPMEQNPVFPDRALWRASAIDHVLAKKNRYIINNNGARNAMLKIGISKGYRWILPFDGNCFLTPAAWKDMTETVMKNTNEKYFYVPMERMQDNAALFDPNFKAEALEEPQLIFRSDAIERFDESLTRYGRRPKVDMLYRLGIPGVWDAQLTKSKPYYETYNFTLSYDIQAKGSVKRASWVARLFSGSAAQEVTSVNSASLRKYNRCVGVARILNWANAIAAEKLYGYSQTVMLAFDYHILNAERASYSAGDKPVATVVEVVKSDAVNWLQESDGFWYRKFDDNTEPIVVSANNYDSANENPASHESRYVAMATIAEKMGVDLWNYGRNDDHIMLNSVYFHLTGEGMPDMILKDKNSRRLSSDALNGFASDIATPRPGTTSLVHVARLQYPDVRLDSDNMAAEGRPAMRSLYLEDLPVEGSDDVNVVRPYWMLGLGKNI
ncbi:hypothetical protein SARC_06041, partial [Sphaeroforma arctica JP610]